MEERARDAVVDAELDEVGRPRDHLLDERLGGARGHDFFARARERELDRAQLAAGGIGVPDRDADAARAALAPLEAERDARAVERAVDRQVAHPDAAAEVA